MLKSRTRPAKAEAEDAGLVEIAAWGAWFLHAHTERLRVADLSPDTYARELAAVEALAAAVTERMRDDYQARKGGKP